MGRGTALKELGKEHTPSNVPQFEKKLTQIPLGCIKMELNIIMETLTLCPLVIQITEK